ncbi:acyl-CoA thioesterase [Amycolatopsis anabasis]|uniref:acyl-CoA thioesterase n=1 Tax=Amycolatopsis anabasis TaxID=1840409 RepID=UPI00131C6BB4|nr:thioesterase family protein [Amycolatopsis anabasis]
MWQREFRLRPSDIDGLGHLTATAYLALFEETRAAWMLEAFDLAYPAYVVATQRIDYLHEVRRDDGAVTVELAVRAIGTSSFEVVETLSVASRPCARSTATLVMWDVDRRRPRPIAQEERPAFESILVRPPVNLRNPGENP